MAALAALAAAGCGQTEGISRGGNIIGETLTVYSLLPEPGQGESRDLVDGERLALQQAAGRAGAFKVNFASLDETAGVPSGELPGAVASAVRRTIADAQVVAVIGDLDARTAEVSVPLLNAAGVLHVSPGVAYPGFVTRVRPGEPGRWYPAGPRTFFSLAPDATAQARALAGAVRGRVLVEQEAGPEGEALGAALRRALGAGRLVASARQADVAVYAGTDAANAQGVVEGLLSESPRVRVVLPPALAGTPLARRSRVRALRAQPDPEPAFAQAFTRAFGRPATPAAAAGAQAMRTVLGAVARAGAKASSRQAVIDAFAARARGGGERLPLYLGRRRL